MLPERRSREITLAVPLPQDWERFCAWARHEGWRVPARELALYRNELADSATVLYEDQVPCGFITVCRHQRHAWIGNLIVDPVRRGEGLGRQLFEHAVGCLAARGVGTLWLTASPAGLPLYQSAGFREVGRIERWILPINGKAQAAAGDLARGIFTSWSGPMPLPGGTRVLNCSACRPGAGSFLPPAVPVPCCSPVPTCGSLAPGFRPISVPVPTGPC